MKTSRRGFLGMFGSAAVAGPRLAQSLASEAHVLSGPSVGMGGYAGGFDKIASASVGDWKVTRIAELTGWIRNGRPEDAHERRREIHYSIEGRERYRLDGLRSVSPVQRHAMFVAGNLDRRERLQKLEWELELSHLTGGVL